MSTLCSAPLRTALVASQSALTLTTNRAAQGNRECVCGGPSTGPPTAPPPPGPSALPSPCPPPNRCSEAKPGGVNSGCPTSVSSHATELPHGPTADPPCPDCPAAAPSAAPAPATVGAFASVCRSVRRLASRRAREDLPTPRAPSTATTTGLPPAAASHTVLMA